MAVPYSKEADLVEEYFSAAHEINSLVHYARVQAHEADLKAKHAMTLAKRAASEAESAQEIAESLASTSNAIARMAYEFANQSPRRFSGFKKVPRQSADSDYTAEEFDTDKSKPLFGNKYDMESNSAVFNTQVSPNENSPKYTESFPIPDIEDGKDLPKEFDSSHSLPIIMENAYQGPRESKPTPWSEKKSLRKIQRKLKGMEIEGSSDEALKDTKSQSEQLLQSVRISALPEQNHSSSEGND